MNTAYFIALVGGIGLGLLFGSKFSGTSITIICAIFVIYVQVLIKVQSLTILKNYKTK